MGAFQEFESWTNGDNRAPAYSPHAAKRQQHLPTNPVDTRVAQFRELCLGFNVEFLRDAATEGATVGDLKKIAAAARERGIKPASLYDFDRKPWGSPDNQDRAVWQATQRYHGEKPCDDDKSIIGVEFEDRSGKNRGHSRLSFKDVGEDDEISSGSSNRARKQQGAGMERDRGVTGKRAKDTKKRCGLDSNGSDSPASPPGGENGNTCG